MLTGGHEKDLWAQVKYGFQDMCEYNWATPEMITGSSNGTDIVTTSEKKYSWNAVWSASRYDSTSFAVEEELKGAPVPQQKQDHHLFRELFRTKPPWC